MIRVSLDSNILVYAADTSAGLLHEQAKRLMRRAGASDCILTLQSLGEFFWATTRKRKLTSGEALVLIQSWRDVFEIRAADEAALFDGADAARTHGISFWDAMLWATARNAGCRILLSQDLQPGRELGGVLFVDPFNPEFDSILDAALA